MRGFLMRLLYLLRDFIKYLKNVSYFQHKESKGFYEDNFKNYYIDFKVKHTLKNKSGIPSLYIVESDEYIIFPGMVIQWLLGMLQLYEEDNEDLKKEILLARDWLIENIEKNYFLPNNFKLLDPEMDIKNDNSAMTSFMIISALIRLNYINLIPSDKTIYLCKKIADSALKSDEKKGACLIIDKDFILQEYTYIDNNIVLNGWIFSILGLYDLINFLKNNDDTKDYENYEKIMTLSQKTFLKYIDSFITKDNWSFYDTKKRKSSPNYHQLHILLLSVLIDLKIITDNKFIKIKRRWEKSNKNIFKKLKYIIFKIFEKIFDKQLYSTL